MVSPKSSFETEGIGDMQTNSRSLIILEKISQVDWFVKSYTKEHRHEFVLVVSTNAAYACQKYGLSYLKIEDYTDFGMLSQESTSILKRFLELEKWLNNWTQQTIPEFGEQGFKPATNASYLLQNLFVEIWSTTVSIHNLLENLQPKSITLWCPTIKHVPRYCHPNVSSIPALLPSVASRLGIEVNDLSTQVSHLTPRSTFDTLPIQVQIGTSVTRYATTRMLQRAKRALSQIPALAHIRMMENVTDVWSYIQSIVFSRCSILCSGYRYDLTDTIRELWRQRVRVTLLTDSMPLTVLNRTLDHPTDFQKKIASTGEKLLQETELWAPLEEWGLDRIDIWSQPIRFWWERLVPVLWERYQYVQVLMKKKNYKSLLTWDNTGSTLSSAAANAAECSNIPVYIYQHGSSSGVDARSWQCFLRPSITFLAYGQGTIASLQQSCPSFMQPCASMLPVGSSRLDRLVKKQTELKHLKIRANLQKDDPRPIILYIPTMFGGYGRMLDLMPYPDISYFELLQNILLIWKEYPDVRLLYKDFVVENNSDRVMAEFIRNTLPNGAVTYQRITDLMWAVDAIIVDHVITAIGEVLLTKKKVLVYMPPLDLSKPEARTLLRRRATVAETPEEFEQQIRMLLGSRDFSEIEHPDSEFLQQYCTHLNDGYSAQRVSSVIIANMEKKNGTKNR